MSAAAAPAAPIVSIDPTLLSFTGAASTEGAFLPSGGTTLFVEGTHNGAGAITGTFDSLVGAIPGVSGNGTLATFVFTAIGAGVSALTLANVLVQVRHGASDLCA